MYVRLLGSWNSKRAACHSWMSTTVSVQIRPVPEPTVAGSPTGAAHNWLHVSQGYWRNTVGRATLAVRSPMTSSLCTCLWQGLLRPYSVCTGCGCGAPNLGGIEELKMSNLKYIHIIYIYKKWVCEVWVCVCVFACVHMSECKHMCTWEREREVIIN